MNNKMIGVLLPNHLKKKICKLANDKGIPVSTFVRSIIVEHLNNNYKAQGSKND